MGPEEATAALTGRPGLVSPQVQSIEFAQIETKVLEGLRLGNECLNRMHQVGLRGLGCGVCVVQKVGRPVTA